MYIYIYVYIYIYIYCIKCEINTLNKNIFFTDISEMEGIDMKNIQILSCTLCKTNTKENNIKCRCNVENVRRSIFELEKELNSKRIKNMKEKFDFERKMYLGRYIKNKIRDVVRVFYELTKDEYEALNIYDEYGEDIFEDLFNIV